MEFLRTYVPILLYAFREKSTILFKNIGNIHAICDNLRTEGNGGIAMLSERLAKLRKKNKWPIHYVAERLGIAKSTYAGYESGYREPSLELLRQLAAIYVVSVDYLLGNEEAKLEPDQEWNDPELGLWFKELAEAPDERRQELKQIWEIIKQRESGRKPGDEQQ